jgi:septum formation protein
MIQPLILASTSPYRQKLLARLGVAFQAERPLVEEEDLKDPALTPQQLAELLAVAKAESLSERHPTAVIIGSDQVCSCDGRILGKAGTPEQAEEQLAFLAGKTHELITAVAIWQAGEMQQHTDLTRLTMRALASDEIQRYVAFDQPWDCAGSYKLESRGITLFEAIESRDHTAIIGLPLLAVAGMLRRLGISGL